MKQAAVGLLLILSTGACPGFALQNYLAGSEEETLVELERTWNSAFYDKDVSVIENILADEFVATYDDGKRGDKARELSLIEEFNQRVVSAVQNDFKVNVYDRTAVVWFTLNLSGLRQGELAEVAFRFTDVFVWRDDRWQCVSSQSTRVSTE